MHATSTIFSDRTPGKFNMLTEPPRQPQPRAGRQAARGVQFLRAAKIKAFLAEAERSGLDLVAEFKAHHLPFALFEDPKRWIPREQAMAAFEIIARRAPPDFALRMGGAWTFNEFGLVGYGLLTCRTYGEFSDRWIEHIEFIGLPLSFRSVVKNDGWSLEMQPRIPLSAAALRMCVEEACASVFPIYRELCGRTLAASRVELTDRNPERDKVAGMRLGTQIRGGAPINRLVMRTADRLSEIHISPAVLEVFVQRHCHSILPEIYGRADILGEVRTMLLLSRGMPPDSAAMATQLNTSKRTLNRRLPREGWTYSDFVERYRYDYARALLRSRELCTKEISYMLDFESPSSFRRAFHRWTGKSVGQWARGELGQPPKRR